MVDYRDTFSPKIDGLLIRRSCEPYPGKYFVVSLTGGLLKDGDYEYKLDIPAMFGSATVKRGPLDEVLSELDRRVNSFVENFDPEADRKHQEDLKFMGQNFYRVVGGGKKRPTRR